MGKFDGIKKMWQVGEKIFPAGSAAEALQVKKALESAGHVGMNKTLVSLDAMAPVANEAASTAARGSAPMLKKGIAGGAGAMIGAGMLGNNEAEASVPSVMPGDEAYKSVLPEQPGMFSKTMHMLGTPQRAMFNKIADVSGVKHDSEDTDDTIHNLVSAGSDAMRIPENDATSALKAGTVAGLSVFADPLAAVPVGKFGKLKKMFVP